MPHLILPVGEDFPVARETVRETVRPADAAQKNMKQHYFK